MTETGKDPLWLHVLIAAAFGCLAAVRLGIPTAPYFDEIHYLPAARGLLDMSVYLNREHPLLGKELLAFGIWAFGDDAIGWRIMPLGFGVLTVFAATRALWFASRSAVASTAYAILLATGFLLFVQSRIAMLDIFMLGFVAVAAWQFAAAWSGGRNASRGFALCGIALGCAMAAKWNAVSVAILPGIAFAWCWLRDGRAPVGLPLGALLLGGVPLAVYAVTYLPVWFFADSANVPAGLFALHLDILSLQQSVTSPHPYQSVWTDWMLNRRSIWYLYERIDSAQRGVLLVGNPVTSLLALPALLWCVWVGVRRNASAELAVAVGFAASLGLWIVADKPIQFYYHYLLPSCFAFAALALALDSIWKQGHRWPLLVTLPVSCGVFAWFYPILGAAPLTGSDAFTKWMWLESWI